MRIEGEIFNKEVGIISRDRRVCERTKGNVGDNHRLSTRRSKPAEQAVSRLALVTG